MIFIFIKICLKSIKINSITISNVSNNEYTFYNIEGNESEI